MQEIIEGVEKLAYEELERANSKFGMFHSTHEGYGVIKEEIEEVEYELSKVKYEMAILWNNIKNNELDLLGIKIMKRHATNLAAESIQVAAMCQKFIDSNLGGK